MLSIRISKSRLPPALFLLIVFSLMLYLLIFMKSYGDKIQLHPQSLIILLWHWPAGVSYSLEGDVCWSMYKIPGCFIKDNHTLFPQADVVVFHHRELWKGRSKLPVNLTRPAKQRWLWVSLESPENNGNLTFYNGLFNWTMSYRRDADVFMPYGKLVPKMTHDTYHIPQKKDCLVCWVVSNYKKNHGRSKIYNQLKKYIPNNLIKLYGHWTKRPLSAQDLLPTISQCHFYLAFENSVYQDYITEKLWRNSLLAGSVPVVYGPPRPDYERLVPSNAFIHVDDFSSIKDLASFLMQVATDKESYESYFRWHDSFEVHVYTDWRERICSICSHYNHLPKHQVYQDLYTWGNK